MRCHPNIPRRRARAPLVLCASFAMALGIPCRLPAAENRPPDPAVTRAIIERLSGLPKAERLHVAIPVAALEDYERRRFREALDLPPAAPVDVVVSRWEAHVPISKEEIRVALSIVGTTLNASPSEPARLSLFPTGTVYEDLRINGEALEPISTNGWFEALLPAPGNFRIEAQLPTRVHSTNSRKRIRFHKGPSTIALVRVDSNLALDVHVANAPHPLSGLTPRGTHGTLAVGSASQFDLVWTGRREAVARQSTVSVTRSVAWNIGERMLSANALLDVAILGGSTDRVVLRLPPGSDNLRVSGPDIKNHRLTGNRIEAFLRGTIGGRTQLRLAFECPRAAGNVVTCPDIEVVNGRLDSGGWLLVANDAGGELLERDTGGLQPASSLDLPADVSGLLAGKPLFVFNRESRRPRLTFDLVTTTPFPMTGTIADRAEMLCVVRPAGDEIVRTRYTVRNAAGQFLRIRLPDGADLLSVTVEEKASQPSRDGEHILVAMPRSVQTLAGLISFPVEIVYCRSGDPLSGSERRLCELPVLADVPAAQVQVTVMHPPGMRIDDYESVLALREAFTTTDGAGLTYGYGYAHDDAWETPWPTTVAQDSDLAYNYYSAGYEAYKEGRLEEAEEYLSNVISLNLTDERTKDAQALVQNIKLGRGEVGEVADNAQRAKVSSIQRGLSKENVKLEAEQDQLITAGIALIEQGDEELGAKLLKGAESLGKKLGQRSVSKVRQKALSSQYRRQLEQTERELRESEQLQERLAELQKKTQKLVEDGGTEGALTLRFGQALERAAGRRSLLVAEVQQAALGVNLDQLGQQQAQQRDVDDLLSYQITRVGGPLQASRPRPTPAVKPSLSRRNIDLKRQVKAIEQALEDVQSSPQPELQTELGYTETQIAHVRKQANKARQKAEQIGQQISGGRRQNLAQGQMSVLRPDEFEVQLRALQQWAGANRWAFDAPDPNLRQELNELTGTIAEARKQLAAVQEEQKAAKNLQVDISGLANAGGWPNAAALERFVTDNYLGVLTNTTAEVQVADGNIVFANTGRNEDVVATLVEKLEQNEGLVVRVSGRNVAVPMLGDIPLLGRLFQSSTANGRRYAMLDEAQYRTLLQTGERARQSGIRLPDNTSDYDRRDVVVGTPNTTAGEDFTLLQGGSTYNGITIDGTRVDLPHNKYLAIDNGSYVTVLRGTEMRNWQEQFQDVPEPATTVAQPLQVPAIGVPVLFEKTYLEAGESPGIVLTYRYKERNRS